MDKAAPKPKKGDRTHYLGWSFGLFLALAVGIIGAGVWYYSAQRKSRLAEAARELSAIADLKVHDIAGWRKERLGDAQTVLGNALFVSQIRSILAGTATPDSKAGLLSWMESMRAFYGYSAILLSDGQDKIILQSKGAGAVSAPDESTRRVEESYLRENRAALSDLFMADDGRTVRMEVCGPIPARKEGEASAGLLVFRIDPSAYLFPFIQSWPTPSPTAETLLVRRDGDDVLFLNELRHQKNTALRLRIPETNRALPASTAIQGGRASLQGRDYRDVPVLAATRTIPDSPWSLVAKVDLEEIMAPLRSEGQLLALLGLAMLAAAGTGIGYVIRGQQAGQRKRIADEIRRHNTELETHVRERTADLEAAVRELEAFSYSVSHDLRAPLRVIDGYSLSLLEDERPHLGKEAIFYLDRIRANAQDMGRLIDDMLALAQTNKFEVRVEDVDLSALARESAAGIARGWPGRSVDLAVAEGLAVRSDPRLLKRVLDNLFDNAWKFTSKTPAPRVEFGIAAGGGKTPVYFVRDNGAGFDMAYAGKLFRIFQRLHTRDEFPGTGVGLATAQRIVARLGGRIWAEGEPGRGATFYFTLSGNEGESP